jgi:hypothetical protein
MPTDSHSFFCYERGSFGTGASCLTFKMSHERSELALASGWAFSFFQKACFYSAVRSCERQSTCGTLRINVAQV